MTARDARPVTNLYYFYRLYKFQYITGLRQFKAVEVDPTFTETLLRRGTNIISNDYTTISQKQQFLYVRVNTYLVHIILLVGSVRGPGPSRICSEKARIIMI